MDSSTEGAVLSIRNTKREPENHLECRKQLQKIPLDLKVLYATKAYMYSTNSHTVYGTSKLLENTTIKEGAARAGTESEMSIQ